MFENEIQDLNEIKESLDKSYVESFSKVAEGFYGETLSDISRSRQTTLLLSSIITILVSLAILDPKGVDFIVFSFDLVKNFSVFGYSISTAFFIGIVVKIFTVYFLIVYGFSVAKDIRYYKHKAKMPAERELELLRRKVTETLRKRQIVLDKVSSKVSETIQTRRNVNDSYWSDYAKLSQKFNEQRIGLSDEQFQIMLDSGFKNVHAKQEEIDKLYEQEKEEAKKLYQQREYQIKTDGVDEGQEILENSLFNFEGEYGKKVWEIVDTYQRYRRFNLWGTVIEVVFPISISIISILIAL